LLAALSVATLGFLRPPAQKTLPDLATGSIQVGQRAIGPATLARQDDQWIGRVDDFPVGSATHFQPRGAPSFFLIRLTDGSFHALSDRSTDIGQRLLQWRDPLPPNFAYGSGRTAGLLEPVHGASYLTDGRVSTGPVAYPLGIFPLTVAGDRVMVGLYCTAGEWKPWRCDPKR
jgi:nitrite reductase/ring-hydroxylating ferredoxin subunit